MQKETTLPRFEQVLENGADACLPRNLSDYWLETLSRQAEDMLDGSSESPTATELTAAIIQILQAKIETATEIQIPFEKLFEFFQRYRIELSMEEVHRKTEMKYEPATIVTIFTDRTVTTWRDDTWWDAQETQN